MTHRVSLRTEAEAEALETRDWHEGRRRGLGAEFRAALDETIERISAIARSPGDCQTMSPCALRIVKAGERRQRIVRGAEPPYRARNLAAMTWSASASLNIDSRSRSTGSASASRPSRRSSCA